MGKRDLAGLRAEEETEKSIVSAMVAVKGNMD